MFQQYHGSRTIVVIIKEQVLAVFLVLFRTHLLVGLGSVFFHRVCFVQGFVLKGAKTYPSHLSFYYQNSLVRDTYYQQLIFLVIKTIFHTLLLISVILISSMPSIFLILFHNLLLQQHYFIFHYFFVCSFWLRNPGIEALYMVSCLSLSCSCFADSLLELVWGYKILSSFEFGDQNQILNLNHHHNFRCEIHRYSS